jgi:Flp pilus assembly protein TadD
MQAGISEFRAGAFAQALAEFKSLLSDPKSAGFARYNLGLIARRAGRKAEARADNCSSLVRLSTPTYAFIPNFHC